MKSIIDISVRTLMITLLFLGMIGCTPDSSDDETPAETSTADGTADGTAGDTNGDTTNGSNISITQAISDEAQMKTIAFDSLAFITGNQCSDTFFPPGKVSDFFGFQYLRDTTSNGFGHNTEFAGKISDSVLSILSDTQVQALVALANTQGTLVDSYGYKRFVLIKAFRRLLENDLPDGTTGLNKTAVVALSGDLYEIDAEISYSRAQVIGGIAAALTDDQKTALTELKAALEALFEAAGEGGSIDQDAWPEATQVDMSDLNDKEGRVLISTYADALFAWYFGSVEGDTYFCPERHGTYFGSFYMKDIPPISATEAVTIDSNLTADMGTDFLNTLDSTQKALITGLVDTQETALNNIVSKRAEISEKLRPFMAGTTVQESEVQTLVRQYGEYDGEIVYNYATNFAAVGNSLTSDQSEALMKIRTDYYERFPDYQANSSAYDCTSAWLYAKKLDEMPEIENTDYLFSSNSSTSVVADGAEITLVTDELSFGEGPASDSYGDIYFSDVTANKIYKWSADSGLSSFRENTGGANGLFFDSSNNLLAGEGTNQQIVSMDTSANVTVLASTYNNTAFNEPNDLWVTPTDGVYFTDPVYFASSVPQGGEHVYYLSSDKSSTIRVIDDMTRPNGIIGTADGARLYVTDHGAGVTYQYTIDDDNTLSNKQIFANVGGDGMTIDSENNIYICENGVLVFNSSGELFETIEVPEQPTNVTFGGSDGQTLYITTRTSLYSLSMSVGR